MDKRASSRGQDVSVKIRYRHQGVSAKGNARHRGGVEVVFSNPQRRGTGAGGGFYDGEVVLGGSWITKALQQGVDFYEKG